ncbi:MAG: hypothetical protein WBD20_17230 [Pirellulaceae bacterium]
MAVVPSTEANADAIKNRVMRAGMPWQWCNLRRNPFGELTRGERAALAVVDVKEIAQQVSENHTAVQFIGECGRGKTTRMLAIGRWLKESSYVYLPEDEPCPSIAFGRPILIDEAQRLPRRVRKQVFATGLPLVLATHRDLSRSLRRFGYTVQTQRIGTNNTPELICRLLNRRIRASCMDAAEQVPELSISDADQLVQRFGSDVRAIESYLYDVVQSQTSASLGYERSERNNGQMRFID